MLKNFTIINKKHILDEILKNKIIFTPFVNIDYNLERNFPKLISEKNKDEMLIILNKCNSGLFSKYNEKEIWDQFNMDISRTCLYIDGKCVKNPIVAKCIIKKHYNSDISDKFGLICTQGALAFIIQEIQNSILCNNAFIAETKNNVKMTIHMNLSKNNVTIKKNLRVIKITKYGDDETIKNIFLTVEFNLNLNDDFDSIVKIEI